MSKPTSKMPDAQQYIMALQNPQISFRSPELRQYRYLRGKTGQPIVYSGGFALTCPVQHVEHQHKIAVRFFYHLPEDMRERYEAISQFIAAASSQFFVSIEYQAEGVLVEGQYYPLCCMDWLEGLTLRDYVRKYVQNTASIKPLAKQFLDLSLELKRLRVAHGDLSHENIMVVNDALMLVDYDGMYVPQLDGRKPCLTGQANFQHPQRVREDEFFGPYQDDFSALAIYISLLSLQYNPTLFDRYHNEYSALLFHKNDFINPERSRYLEELDQIPDLAELARRFRLVCQQGIYDIPSLSDFLSGTPFSITKSDIGLRTSVPSEFRLKKNIIGLPEPRRVTPVSPTAATGGQGPADMTESSNRASSPPVVAPPDHLPEQTAFELSEPTVSAQTFEQLSPDEQIDEIDKFMSGWATHILKANFGDDHSLRSKVKIAVKSYTPLKIRHYGSPFNDWVKQSNKHRDFARLLMDFATGQCTLFELGKSAERYIKSRPKGR